MQDDETEVYKRRPSPHELFEVWGYLQEVWVEQVSARDRIGFKLAVFSKGNHYDEWDGFVMYLDIEQTVALSQLQLLLDAMEKRWLVKVHYYERLKE